MRLSPFVLFVVILLASSIGCEGRVPTTPATNESTAPTDSNPKLKVEIAKGKLAINGTTVAFPYKLTDVEKLLGPQSGAVDDPLSELRKCVFWNGLGISGRHQKAGKQELEEIEFSYNGFWDLSAKTSSKPFTGDFVLEGQLVTKSTKPAELSQKIDVLHRGLVDTWWIINYEEPPLQVHLCFGTEGVEAVHVDVKAK